MKINRTILALSLASLVATLFIYNRLPDQIPIHWGLNGQVDRYGDRYFAFILGGLPLLMYGLMLIIPKIDPRRDSYAKHMGAYQIIVNLVIFFLIGIHWATMVFSLGYKINIALIIKMGLGLLFMVIGNYLPIVKHNYTLGIRTPWTLADEVVWEKTHRLGGYGFVLSGLLWFIFSFFDYPWVFYLLIGTLITMVLGVFVYSYVIFAKRRDQA